MTSPQPMRDFELEVFFSKWEFKVRHHMTASDMESLSLSDLLQMAAPEDRERFEKLWLGYTQTWGAPQLRDEIAKTYSGLAAENILCLAGAAEGLYAVAKVLLSAGDHVITTVPNYQSAETVPLAICEVTGVPIKKAMVRGGWKLDLDELRAAIRPNTKLISLNFPQNPTGMVLPHEDLKEIVALCRERGIWLFVDEVYRGVELDPADRLPQVAQIYERGISLNVMSKAYGMPGLRVGWIAAQDLGLLEKVERYKHYLSICNSAPSEALALIALKSRDQILARNHALLKKNVEALEQLFAAYPGLVEWTRPLGGCVAFPRFLGPEGGEAFCRKLLEVSGVLLLPGSIYRSELGDVPEDHFRIGFGRGAVFEQGLAAMRQHFEAHYPQFKA
ncbi:aminotransferase class I/II-fold pyridoxal phosphate-dependent enzyme [Pseudovibrio exalbescens]|uniref:aminotransferase class I/II-fold pyridoxal phosphate-dependent enzyme n=1 Tax=Pseudovibrio exalbescens TaxID=197461 RepID=UPI00236688DE|nr:aminotransferase class I/II-fold pyridoxal phosphate-dependent enzyme [Pseudovibrio exalbescens]MDD7909580.1 aminotransferase class I/II-fold pyridoxal phosphate-dependent enzyme [Pseudovibrio exalbescens]